MRRVSRWLALDRRPGRGAGLPTVEVVAAEDYYREVNDLRDQVQMYEEKAERDWRDFGEMQDARIAADDRVVELEKELAMVCKQLDSANDMVERDGETPQNRRDLEAREDWRAARVDAINRGDLSFDRGFISGLTAGRAAASPDPPDDREGLIAAEFFAAGLRAASPDERLREAVAALPQYVITIQDREGYTYERGCAGQPMNYTGVLLADVEALIGELKDGAPVTRETTDELKDALREIASFDACGDARSDYRDVIRVKEIAAAALAAADREENTDV